MQPHEYCDGICERFPECGCLIEIPNGTPWPPQWLLENLGDRLLDAAREIVEKSKT